MTRKMEGGGGRRGWKEGKFQYIEKRLFLNYHHSKLSIGIMQSACTAY